MQLEGKVAIVTGGASGIGEATVRSLCREGARVVISDINWPAAKNLEENLTRKGMGALAVKTDTADYEQVKELTEKTLSSFGRIDILVNNAGISSPGPKGKKAKLWEMSVEEWNRVIDVDLNGYFLCCHEVVPKMILNRWGRIINVSSQAARYGPGRGGSAYITAKIGVVGLTKALAGEVGGYGITVNAVAPGMIDTPMTKGYSPELKAEFIKLAPLGRIGTPQDVAGTIMFLISEAASFITGATLDVNGGRVMY
ncbi:MAG: SDR family oxidoreductase [Thermodesulfobacteriota bacterium]